MVFLDTNILLELVLNDRPRAMQVRQLLEKIEDRTAISLLGAHLVMHFGRKVGADDTLLQAFISENELLNLTAEDYTWAVAHERGRDFEDALQMAVALRAGCEAFITLDRKLARAYAETPIVLLVP